MLCGVRGSPRQLITGGAVYSIIASVYLIWSRNRFRYQNINKMKKENVYGVEMTSIQNMIFSKWVSNEGIAMNTKTIEERKQITLNWITKYEKDQLGQNIR